jgi:ATP-dependent Clp protease ATP-binding subunit ClpA
VDAVRRWVDLGDDREQARAGLDVVLDRGVVLALTRRDRATTWIGATWDGLSRARQEAADRGDRRVGTQHLLLALLDRPEGDAQRLLLRVGATRAECETVLAALRGAGRLPARREPREVGDGDRALRVLERAALTTHDGVIRDETLLAALVAEGDHGLAGAVFTHLGVRSRLVHELLT